MSAHIILHHNGFHTVMEGWMDGWMCACEKTNSVHTSWLPKHFVNTSCSFHCAELGQGPHSLITSPRLTGWPDVGCTPRIFFHIHTTHHTHSHTHTHTHIQVQSLLLFPVFHINMTSMTLLLSRHCTEMIIPRSDFVARHYEFASKEN